MIGRGRQRRLTAGILGGLALVGCAATRPPRTRFFRLDPTVPSVAATSSPALAGVLVVERLVADPLVAERPMLHGGPPSLEVRQHPYHYWVEPPPEMLQYELAAHLRARAIAAVVTTPDLRLRADYVVRGRLRRFERVTMGDRPSIVVEAQLSMSRARRDQLLWSGTYRAEIVAEGGDVPNAVAAFNRGVDDVCTRFAADIAAAVTH
jgi:ABC-type uncharacterized transport system auxiliary subunit